MKFSKIFWTTFKVRAAIAIQDEIINSVEKSKREAELNKNLPVIFNNILENKLEFDSFLEKQRKLIQVEKALSLLPEMKNLNHEQKKSLEQELVKLKNQLS